jgi:hypothetical protein
LTGKILSVGRQEHLTKVTSEPIVQPRAERELWLFACLFDEFPDVLFTTLAREVNIKLHNAGSLLSVT